MSEETKDKALFERFIDIYNRIDAFMRQQPGVDKHADHMYLIQETARRNPIFARNEHQLKTFAALRNVLVHSPFMALSHPMATPGMRIVERYQQLCDAILNPPTALSIAVPGPQIYTTTLDSNALELMKLMSQKTYTHVPVMESDHMIGVFSENTLLAYVAHNEEVVITRDLTVVEFRDFIGLDKHPSEQFEFLSRKAMLADVYKVFNQALKAHKRLGVIFITEHGEALEKPLGLITAWDLANPDFDS